MEEVHILSLQLFELVRQYEDVIKEDKESSQARELRNKILEIESELRFRKQQLVVD